VTNQQKNWMHGIFIAIAVIGLIVGSGIVFLVGVLLEVWHIWRIYQEKKKGSGKTASPKAQATEANAPHKPEPKKTEAAAPQQQKPAANKPAEMKADAAKSVGDAQQEPKTEKKSDNETGHH